MKPAADINHEHINAYSIPLQFATPEDLHTPSVEDLPQACHMGECDLQIDWHVKLLHLKFTPLCATLWFNVLQRV